MMRSVRVPVFWALVALALLPVASTYGQSDGGSVTADKEGWWNRTRGATSGTPIGGGGVPVPPDTVPKGAIGIAAKAGQVEKVAALGIVLDAERGSTVGRFVLEMKEAEGTAAQQNSGDAAIVACPITSFFAGAENGAFQDAPAADCDAAKVDGKRSDDGTWTFDLVPIAEVWLDPFGTLSPNGIRFDPTGTTTFQVSLTGLEDAAFDVSISAPEEDPNPFDASTTTVPGGFTGSSSSGGSGGAATRPPPVDVGGDPTATTVARRTAPGPTGGDEVAGSPSPGRAGDTSSNLPGGVPLLLVLAVAVALLTAWHLGPAGRLPHAKTQRTGGVSRALAARPPSTGAPR